MTPIDAGEIEPVALRRREDVLTDKPSSPSEDDMDDERGPHESQPDQQPTKPAERSMDFMSFVFMFFSGCFGAGIGLFVALTTLQIVYGNLRGADPFIPSLVMLTTTAAGAYLFPKWVWTSDERERKAALAKEEFIIRAREALWKSYEVPDRAPDEAESDDRFKPGDPTDIRP